LKPKTYTANKHIFISHKTLTQKEVLITMDNCKSRQLLPMPFPKPLKEMTGEELTKLLTGKFNYNVLIPGLIEANLRKDKHITVDLCQDFGHKKLNFSLPT